MTPCSILRANHTGFTVSDVAKAAGFFRDVLGFRLTEPVRQIGPAVEKMTGVSGADIEIIFAIGPGCTVELMQYHAPEGLRDNTLRPCDPGFAHIAFEVANIKAIAPLMRAAGATPLGEPQVVPAGPRKGGLNLYVRGPDNIVIEFQQAPAGYREPTAA